MAQAMMFEMPLGSLTTFGVMNGRAAGWHDRDAERTELSEEELKEQERLHVGRPAYKTVLAGRKGEGV